MKIALAQLNPTVGDINGNIKKIISIIKKINADIVVFPELSVTGYGIQDLLLKRKFVDENVHALAKIVKAAKNKAAIAGFIERAGENIYNSAAVIINEKIVKIHRKICLPNYAVFDEKRWFKKGSKATIFDFLGQKIGVSICEDIWFPQITKMQKENGADLIINISASPYSKTKIDYTEAILRKRWEENKIPIIYVNQCGAQDGIVYYGHSMFVDNGRIIQKAKDFKEEIMVVEV